MKFYYTYCDQSYAPVAGGALPDSEYLAALGDRLMFRHGSPTQPKLALFVAPRGILHAGWVIGVFDEPFITETETIKAEPGARYPFTASSIATRATNHVVVWRACCRVRSTVVPMWLLSSAYLEAYPVPHAQYDVEPPCALPQFKVAHAVALNRL